MVCVNLLFCELSINQRVYESTAAPGRLLRHCRMNGADYQKKRRRNQSGAVHACHSADQASPSGAPAFPSAFRLRLHAPAFSASSSAVRSSASHASFSLRARWKARPVPAGIRRPTMTFSFRPRRPSRLPMIAASVSTRVVSWNDAAEMNESVDSDALVIPSSTFS